LITPTTTATATVVTNNKKPAFVATTASSGPRVKSNLTLPNNELSKKTSGDTFGKSANTNKAVKTSKSSKNVGKKSSSGGKNVAAKLKMKQKDVVNVEEMLNKLQNKNNKDTVEANSEQTQQQQAHALSLEFHDKKPNHAMNFNETHDMFPAGKQKHETPTNEIHSLVTQASRQTQSNVDVGRC